MVQAVMGDVARRHTKGQPILIGTTSVEASENLDRILTEFQVQSTPHPKGRFTASLYYLPFSDCMVPEVGCWNRRCVAVVEL